MKRTTLLLAVIMLCCSAVRAQILLAKKDSTIKQRPVPTPVVAPPHKVVTHDIMDYYPEFKNAVANHYLVIGMPEAVVELSTGEPNEINRSVGSWGVHMQWIYRDGFNKGVKDGKTKYVYIENAILTSWQD